MIFRRKRRRFRGKVWPGSFGIIYWICYDCRDKHVNEQGRLTLAAIPSDDSDFGGHAIDLNQGSDLLRNHLVVVHGEIK
jgi:hypothetical protein